MHDVFSLLPSPVEAARNGQGLHRPTPRMHTQIPTVLQIQHRLASRPKAPFIPDPCPEPYRMPWFLHEARGTSRSDCTEEIA